MRQGKQVTLKLINEEKSFSGEVYGAMDFEPKMYINIERIWNDIDSEEDFIISYSRVILHEYLHYIIDDVLTTMYIDKEEEIVDKLSKTDSLPLKEKKVMQVFKLAPIQDL